MQMINSLINRYKQFKKNDRLNNLGSYSHQYAFVGVGGHSLDNLYPVIDYLGVPLKYIHSRTVSNAEKLAPKYGFRSSEIKIKIIGKKPGEKLVEELITNFEMDNVLETKEFFIVPNNLTKQFIGKYPNSKISKNLYDYFEKLKINAVEFIKPLNDFEICDSKFEF